MLTSIRQPAERRRHRFSWINEWKETADRNGRPCGLELILPDWFYAGVLDDALVLTIDRAYFDLTGGLERWLYRLVRKHGGRQQRRLAFRSSCISTPSPAASRRSSTLHSTCARSSGGRHCPAMSCAHARPQTAPSD